MIAHYLAANPLQGQHLPAISSKVAYIVLALIMGFLIFKGTTLARLYLIVGLFMGVLLVAFFPAINTWTAKIADQHLGGGPGALATIVLVGLLIVEIAIFILERRNN